MSQKPLLSEPIFAPSPSVRAIAVGGRTGLFCERSQQLCELNDSASRIWRELAAGVPCIDVIERWRAPGASPEEAERLVRPLLNEWLRLGYLAPRAAMAALEQAPAARMTVAVGPLIVELRYFGDAEPSLSATPFADMRCENAAPRLQIGIVADGDADYVFVGRTPRGRALRRQTAPRLKAILTEEYCRSAREGFLAHGALLSAAGKRVFLGGAPGAGKSTLALALVGEGFAYGGDDIVHVGEDGAAVGVPFPAAAKSGAWRALAAFVPELASLPIHEREDGELARYVRPARRDLDGPRAIDAMLLLQRAPGAEARLEPLDALEALCALLESGYSERRGVSARTIESLAERLSAAVCARVVYDDLGGAATLVKRLAHG